MISTVEVADVNHFAISCINGQHSPNQVKLDIKRDNKILLLPSPPNFKVDKQRNKKVVAKDFQNVDNIGIFYCESTEEAPHALKTVTMINNCRKACDEDMYGPDCKLNCKCQNGGVCNRFRGCQCQTGWRGRNCEKSGPSSPLNVQATTLSLSAIQVRWRPPENPNGGIVKYVIEYQAVGQESPHPWVDTDDGNKTTKDVTALNSSTAYQFRVRAFSKVPGEWSHFVQAKTQGDGSQILAATTQSVASKPAGEGSQLLEAVVGSVAVTCVTIMLALLVLFFIRKSLLNRRRTFTYQSGSGEETILQFNSGTLTLTRRPKPIPEPLTYPILEWEDIKFEDIIGEGNFGQVIKAMIKKDGNKMSAAIKMLKEFASENDHRDFAGELEVLCKLGQHPNIINLIGACENRDRAPQILELDGNIEWNLNSSPQISCSATGNPLPDHKSIDLRKLDGSVLKPTQTTIDSNKSTAVFDIPRMSAQLGGLWECRVSTNGGQDSRRFNITLKGCKPPVPTTAPKLLQKRSKQLLVMPAESYRGDGPIISTRLIYKPVENGDSWSSIIVYSDKEPITLMNLEPSTRYRVRVQLSRPGQKGEGVPGPEAIMETDCPEPTIQPQIDNSSVEGRSATLRWRLPKNSGIAAGTASGFLVQLFAPPPIKEKLLEETTLLNVLSTKFHNLEYHQDYSVVVRLVNCDSQGPPSEPFHLRINSQGPSSPLNVQATTLSLSAIQVRWRPPENPNGGIVKYVIEYQAVGQESPHPWVDTDDGNKTTKDVTALNSSTAYQFRVRAFSKVPGEWSHFVQAKTQGDGSQILAATTQSVASKPAGEGSQLLEAVVGSVAVTCVTIMLALLVLFFIRKSLLNRRRTFTYQSGSGEETILQFNSGTLTLTRRPKPIPEPLTFPILEWEDIKFEDIIGEGNFGQVIKAMIKKDGNKMSAAIKMLKEFASENDHRDFAGELEVLCKLGQHPNIINLIGACENRGYLYIAIEYAPYGNLLDFLRKSRVLETDPAFAKEHGTASTLTSQQLLQFAVDVATGMHYLSDKQVLSIIVISPIGKSVLTCYDIASSLFALLALVHSQGFGSKECSCRGQSCGKDFGLSRGEEVYVKKTMGRLPVRWMAIESLNYSVYTTKSDVWSFGVLLWEIVSLGGTPYCGMTCAELYEKLPQGYRMEKPKNCDDEVQCWRDRPYERPPFSQISVQLSRMQETRKAYVNMALFENFTYAGIDATGEEA
ncbi:unnamed protein product [Menidia menidia]|uniref:(Atlantic silverside) hypothetical protein n=1 Tax=Menidia menidia TaxID=238744 RepID=A0A8S4A9T2_9TELE|nr:unnamed protein product [Menidia menidia]